MLFLFLARFFFFSVTSVCLELRKMKIQKFTWLALVFALIGFSEIKAQIIDVRPIFPHQTDTVTITYDATEGNSALTGVVPVYAHTGVISNVSTTPTDWQHVQGNWGTADNTVLMTPLGSNLHQIQYHIPTYYNLIASDSVYRLAFVFRNTTGSVVGREFDGSDIFYPVYPTGQLFARFVQPDEETVLVNAGGSIPIFAAASDTANLTITDNGTTVTTTNAMEYNYSLTAGASGTHEVILNAAANGQTAADTFYYVVNPVLTPQDPPVGTELGINYTSNTSVRLWLYAPGKQNIYVIGSFNNYQANPAYAMRKSLDGNSWWVDITGLTAGQIYTFQYLVDGQLKIAEPYSELVLDPWNDQYILPATYPNMPPYPAGLTDGIVTVLEPGRTPYNWQVNNFTAPDEEKLVVYELLIRDFLLSHDYATLLDTLDYIEKLGINAIELMPVNEFEGNESWGYNPSFHMALDKYYGPAEDFKAFIDECHARGIAIILDVVYNHAFSQSPFAQLYWDQSNFKPRPDNPWLNPDPTHPFNVGSDFNHEAQPTKDFVHRNIKYWMDEYRIDGFRFDLSKGFTQTPTDPNVGLWSNYDASRVAILKAYADTVWAQNPNAYVILEHFSDNSEETELANYGMMIWGNHNHNYNEASMGYIGTSNFEWIDYKRRNWNDPKVMGYMESHDEERLMYKNLQFGNSNGSYDIATLGTALGRMELVGALFFPVPGPKMTLMMSELGYDHSTLDPCNICPKPILWNYNTEPDRRRVYKVWSALSKLKQDYPAFSTTNYQFNAGGAFKTLYLDDNSMNVAVAGNFEVSSQNATLNFQHTGKWYEYFTGDSINLTNTTFNLNMTPGEYRLYTDVRLPLPDLDGSVAISNGTYSPFMETQLWPNPSSQSMRFEYHLPSTGEVSINLFDLQGRQVGQLAKGLQVKGKHVLTIDKDALGISNGHYLLKVMTAEGSMGLPVVFLD